MLQSLSANSSPHGGVECCIEYVVTTVAANFEFIFPIIYIRIND